MEYDDPALHHYAHRAETILLHDFRLVFIVKLKQFPLVAIHEANCEFMDGVAPEQYVRLGVIQVVFKARLVISGQFRAELQVVVIIGEVVRMDEYIIGSDLHWLLAHLLRA